MSLKEKLQNAVGAVGQAITHVAGAAEAKLEHAVEAGTHAVEAGVAKIENFVAQEHSGSVVR